MNNENAPYTAPANAYSSQNTTPGPKMDAQNEKTEKAAACLEGVPKPSPADYNATPEQIKTEWEAHKADQSKLGENHW